MNKNRTAKLFSLRQAEKLMGRRYRVVRRFGPMLPDDEGKFVNVEQTSNGYLLLFAARQRGDASQFKTAYISPRELLCLREIEIAEPIDLLISCGEKYWRTPEDLIREIDAMGFSHRLPANFDARRVRKGASRVFLGHQKAVMRIGRGTIEELLAYLQGLNDSQVTRILQQGYTHPPSRLLELPPLVRGRVFRQFQITFAYGIFGYVYASAATYYLKANEKETPARVAQRGYIGVRAKRIKEQVVIDNGKLMQQRKEDEEVV